MTIIEDANPSTKSVLEAPSLSTLEAELEHASCQPNMMFAATGDKPFLLPTEHVVQTIKTRRRKLQLPMLVRGKLVYEYEAVHVVDYCHIPTGNTVGAYEAERIEGINQMRFSEMCLQREAIVKGLRKEVRDFACFVLKFRDSRRGLTPDIKTLAGWYAELHDRRPADVRRLIVRLEEAGILVDNCMTPLFQINRVLERRSQYLGEAALARAKFERIKLGKVCTKHRCLCWM